MSVSVSDAGRFEKIVAFEVTNAEIDAASGAAAKRLSQNLRVPGFRPGKAPRKVVEAHLGTARLRSEAIDDLLPEKLGFVLEGIDIEPAVTPRLEKMDDTVDGVAVEVRVTTWPSLDEVPEIHDRAVEVGPVAVEDDEIDAQLLRFRQQFASLSDIDRPVAEGDYITLDIAATADGEELEEASAQQLVYEVGRDGFIDGIDEAVTGVVVGDTVTFDSVMPEGFENAGRQVTFSVTVTAVKQMDLPDLTDDWVEEVSEFDGVAEMREALRRQMSVMRLQSVVRDFRERALGDLVDQVDIEIPESLISAEMDELIHRFGHRLEEQGVDFADYLQVSGQSRDDFAADLRMQADRSIRTRLLLDAIVDQEGIEVSDDELVDVIGGALASGEQAGTDPAMFREALRGTPQEKSLIGDILRTKALEVIVNGARPVDGTGADVDLDGAAAKLSVEAETVYTGQVVDGVVEGELGEGDLVEAEVVGAEVVEAEVVATGSMVERAIPDEEE